MEKYMMMFGDDSHLTLGLPPFCTHVSSDIGTNIADIHGGSEEYDRNQRHKPAAVETGCLMLKTTEHPFS